VVQWPLAYKAYVGREPNQNIIDRRRMARENGQNDWGTFFYPIPDPMNVARPVLWNENPITSGMRANIVDMTMSGPNPLCRNGGGY